MRLVLLASQQERHDAMRGYARVRRLRLAPPPTDPHAWANRIRGEMGWAATCGQPGHLVNTPFRRAQKLRPVDECQLRDLAQRQADEARAVKQ